MKFVDERECDPAARRLRARILEVLPAGGYQLDRLFQLFDIEVTEAVPTAAVSCGGAPRLAINPQFVARHCQTDEALFVVVLHELLHVVLGHTRLFRRMDPAHNIAFDAVINAMIARQHPEPEFLELLCAVNDWQHFPGRLLRPAPGWPNRPESLPADASPKERQLHARLYGTDSNDVTYHEIFELLGELLQQSQAAGTQKPPVLLGRHGDESGGGAGDRSDEEAGDELVDPTLRDVLGRIVREWPAPFREGALDRGAKAEALALAARDPADLALERALAAFFARAGVCLRTRNRERLRPCDVATSFVTAVPQAGDRRGQARALALGRQPLFWDGATTRRVRARRPVPRAFVYLDVSGSMDAILPFLRAALVRPVRDGAARLFAFSTAIFEVDVRSFGSRATQSTGGTEINAVLQHLLALSRAQRPRSVALVTDGFVGRPRADLVRRLAELRIGVHVALTPGGARTELAALASDIVQLPAPGTAPAARNAPRRPA